MSPPSQPYRFEAIRSASGLDSHAGAWDDLAAHATEPNSFQSPSLLRPALEAFAGNADLHIVLAYSGEGPRATLKGLFPFERARRYRGLPLPHLRSWRYVHGYLSTPLVRRGSERECLGALMRHLRVDRLGSALVEWDLVGGDGPFLAALNDVAREDRLASTVSRVYDRALLRRREHSAAYLAEAFSGKRRRDFQRLRKRLAEVGPVAFECYKPGADANGWIECFLALESSGWKGKNGTAMDCSERNKAFFRQAVLNAAGRGQLAMLAMRVGEKTVAMQCHFQCGEGAFAFKIAYDESFARYSPGVLLELEYLERFHQQSAITWMDSCATPQHALADRLWIDRRVVKTVVTSTGRVAGQHIVPLLPWAHRAARVLRGPSA